MAATLPSVVGQKRQA